MHGTGAYSASRLAFTRVMAVLHAETTSLSSPANLRIHSFHPGNILTPPVRIARFDEKTVDRDDAELPGHLAVWLASQEAAWLNGRFVWANWDVEELSNRKAEFEARRLLRIGFVGNAEWPIENGYYR